MVRRENMEWHEEHELECPNCKAKVNLVFERKPFEYKLERVEN